LHSESTASSALTTLCTIDIYICSNPCLQQEFFLIYLQPVHLNFKDFEARTAFLHIHVQTPGQQYHDCMTVAFICCRSMKHL